MLFVILLHYKSDAQGQLQEDHIQRIKCKKLFIVKHGMVVFGCTLLFITFLEVESSEIQIHYPCTPPPLRSMYRVRKNVEVRLLDNEERGAFATRHFAKGDFVCEYASK